MGEVWLAQDTRLRRQVAVKVLPDQHAGDPERLARFEQEARAAAALNHPNIAVLFDVGHADGVHYMVQELLEGHTLRHLVHEGPPPVGRALELCTQVARALARAHQAGIVHRDLKPDNVFVTEEGQAKVLDFGLAKLMDTTVASELSDSPTVLGSVVGQVMGTAGYMAPEQVASGDVDERADVFAFGCLLFETVTGRRAFPGDTVFEMLNGILKDQPETLSSIDAELPLELQRVLSKCLQKEPGRRYQSTDDLVVDMESLSGAVADGSAIPLSAQSALGFEAIATARPARPWVALGVTVAAAAVALLAGYWLGSRTPAADDAVTRFSIPLEPGQQIQDGVLLSRDGRQLAYSVLDPDGLKVILRPLDTDASAPIDGTLGAVWPFLSPDGNWMGFSVGDDLLKVPIAGGNPLELGMATSGGLASWGTGGVILFSDDGTLYTVPAAGGERSVVPAPPEEGMWYRRPRYVADTNTAVTEFVEMSTNIGQVVWIDIETGASRVLIDDGWDPRYVPSGHLIYTREDGIWAVAYDLAGQSVVGDPVRVLSNVLQRFAQAQFDVSDNGVMAYVPEAESTATEGLAWLAPGETPGRSVLGEVDGSVSHPRISPDGRRIALLASEGDSHSIWIYDLGREAVTLFAEDATTPVWGGDGDQIFYASADRRAVYGRRLDLGAEAELVLQSDDPVALTDISPDNEFLLFNRDSGVYRVELGTGAVEPVLDRDLEEWGAVLSPDGRWLAYVTERAGRNEVFVSSYPDLTATEQISTAGGSNPRWSPDGRALFFTNTLGDTYSPHDIWRVPIAGGSQPGAGVATRIHTQVLDQRFDRANFDVADDGRLIVPSFLADGGPGQQKIQVVMNWFTELRRLVPATR